MIHEQRLTVVDDDLGAERRCASRHYAYCGCGWCGRLRLTRLAAVLDEGRHADAHVAADRKAAP